MEFAWHEDKRQQNLEKHGMDEDWAEIIRGVPETVEPKKHLNIRLDADVWRWFRAQGKGYQSKINAVLRAYMQVQQRKQQQSSHQH